MRFTRWEALLESLDQPLVFYDTETSHVLPERAQVLEFGAAMYGPAHLLEEGAAPPDGLGLSLVPGLLYTLSQRVCPPAHWFTIPGNANAVERSSRVHGIDVVALSAVEYSPVDLARDASDVLGAGTVCGFNSAEYDDLVLAPLRPGWYTGAPCTRVDVLRVFRAVTGRAPRPERQTHGFVIRDDLQLLPPLCCLPEYGAPETTRDTLGALSAVVLGVAHTAAHGALPDAMRSAEVLAAIMELWPETCPGDLAGLEALTKHPDAYLSGHACERDRQWDSWDRMLKLELGEWIWQRGKHRGCTLAETDSGYLHWCAKKSDFGEQTKVIIRSHMRSR